LNSKFFSEAIIWYRRSVCISVCNVSVAYSLSVKFCYISAATDQNHWTVSHALFSLTSAKVCTIWILSTVFIIILMSVILWHGLSPPILEQRWRF